MTEENKETSAEQIIVGGDPVGTQAAGAEDVAQDLPTAPEPVEQSSPEVTADDEPKPVACEERKVVENVLKEDDTEVAEDNEQPWQLSHPCNDIEDYDELFREQVIENKAVQENVGKRGTRTDQFYNLRDNPLTTANAKLLMEHVFDIAGETFEEKKLSKNNTWECSENVSGDAALLAFTAKGSGLYRLHLYNTGIYLDLRSSPPAELNTIFATVDLRGERIGSILGDFQHMPYSILFKEAIMDVLPKLVVRSNLKNWNRGNTLARAISINDYEPIVWALAAMQTDRKLDVNVECLECSHHYVKSYDFGRFHLLRNIPQEALEYIHSHPEDVDNKALAEYQKMLGFNGRTIDYHNLRSTLKVPSLYEVVTNGKKILASIESRITDEPTYFNQDVVNELLLRTNNNFVPWIREICNIEDGKPTNPRTEDSEQFAAILNIHGLDEGHLKFQEPLKKFQMDSKASVIGYSPVACNNCSAIQPTKSGYVAWDPERVFFEIAYQTLERDGISRTE